MNNVAVGDFKVCKDAANQFYYVAKLCSDRAYLDYMANTFYPYSVNVSFACELYMKAIMIYRSDSDEFLKGHDLKVLFEHLESSDAMAISTRFAEKYSKKTMDVFLEENKNTFVDWRYALEHGVEMDLKGFEVFADILNEYVKGLG